MTNFWQTLLTILKQQSRYQEQIGGNPLATQPGRFVFTLNPYVERHSEHMGVAEHHYTANLRQEGQFIQHQRLTRFLSDAIYSSLQNLIRREQIPGHDYLYFNLASNQLNHAYGYWCLTAEEWMRGSDHVDGILEQMAHVLNSNEQFELDDSIQLSFTQVRAVPLGSGKQKIKQDIVIPKRSNAWNIWWSQLKRKMISAVGEPLSLPRRKWTVTQTGIVSKEVAVSKSPMPFVSIMKPASKGVRVAMKN